MHNNPVLSQREAPPEALEVAVHDSMRGIPEAVWDNLLGADGPPFLRWAFLDALERTGCVGDAAGWAPHHLTLVVTSTSQPCAGVPLQSAKPVAQVGIVRALDEQP